MLEFFQSIDIIVLLTLVLSVGLVLAFEFVNGFHDTANAVATVIYTKSLKPRLAVFLSGIFNFLGVLLGGLGVAYAIVNLLPMDLLANANSTKGLVMVVSLLVAALIWNLGTWYFGIPASSSHTLIGSILGVGLANALLTDHSLVDGVNWDKALGVFESLLFSPFIGAGLAGLLLLLLLRFLPKSYIHKTPYQRHVLDKKKKPPFWPRFWLVTSAMGMSYAHGQNDGQKGIGLVMLVLFSVVPAQFVLNLNSSVFEIEQTRVAAQQMVSYYEANQKVLDELYPKSDHAVSDGLFSCEYSEMRQHSEKLISLLNGIDTYDRLSTDERWAVRNEVMCLASIAKTLESQDALPESYRKSYKAIGKDLTKTTEYAPFWVIVAVALALGMGTMIGWKRVVDTVGGKIGKKDMTYAQGMSAQIVSGIAIASASHFGFPVSTTHILSSSVAGTMIANKSGLQKSTVKNILLAWILTLPVSTGLAFGLYFLGTWLFVS
ncbi:inorganic phosphate transporter [Ignatzschineria cameli]|uniref:Phosphate transporter n=1 Tax=Ignatzschineria cameli TaxID=2182793 RepID=A0A2U2ARN8_9GAMM|nr:inorganic phosphate transporter [Ignatzschineria cameli]PWD86712.1 anion permease [Ignatzschineria cameli]PWD86935.1 anion permease [Ignatzschineria cameli]PWD91907.1 anion permease [Ignatzschineria cameli]PWD93506.1 anion permease [Ignatzschineria cameli]PWD94248.1 anion permease [Ignatzschineria cameli]